MRVASRPRLLIVGNGMAGVRLCEELVALRAAERWDIEVIGAEPVPGYNRVLLSAHLAGEADRDAIDLRGLDWYAGHGIALTLGRHVTALDRVTRVATLDDGSRRTYDALVLATGSDAIRLPLPGADLPGVHTFRDLADTAALQALGPVPRRVAVIGGGLLGLEAAHGLARAGHAVTVVHVMDRLMERQLDRRAAGHLRRAVERLGIAVRLGAETRAVTGETAVTGLAFADGTALETDAVVMAVGIRPRVVLAGKAGLAVHRGIVVDDRMQAAPGIFAIGECAEHRGQVYGLVEPAYRQARVLAQILCGLDAAYAGSVLATNLKVSGVPVFSVGAIEADGDAEAVIAEDRRRGEYRKLVIRDGRLIGAILVGETGDALWYRDLVLDGADISGFRDDLIFGRTACAPRPAEAA